MDGLDNSSYSKSLPFGYRKAYAQVLEWKESLLAPRMAYTWVLESDNLLLALPITFKVGRRHCMVLVRGSYLVLQLEI